MPTKLQRGTEDFGEAVQPDVLQAYGWTKS